MLSLDIAIATHRQEGIRRFACEGVLPRIDGVRYVVSWQEHGGMPLPEALARRADVEVHRFDGRGQSLNRNNSLDHCKGDLVLVSDDDVDYDTEGLQGLRRAMEENPAVDVAMFKSVHSDMSRFPSVETPLSLPLPKGYHASGIEIVVRRKGEAARLRFCPELGLASPSMHGGEDEVFLLTAIKRGLVCRFFPVVVCTHQGESTGTVASPTREHLRAAGCVIKLYYPATASLRVVLKAMRMARAGRTSFGRALRHLAAGMLAAGSMRRRNTETLW